MEILRFEGEDGQPKVVISPNVLKDIDFLHENYKDLEWSGVIFYSMEGNLTDPSKLSFLIHGFYLMDLGTSGFTKFDFNSNMPDIYFENPEILENEWNIGLMHSHHNMATFFSGEDSRVLHVNADFFPQFLSLIVNCSGSYKAKVSTIVSVSTVEVFDNIPSIPATVKDASKFIQVYDCDIEKVVCCEKRFHQLAKQRNLRFKDSLENQLHKPFMLSVSSRAPQVHKREEYPSNLLSDQENIKFAEDEETPTFDENFGKVETTKTGIPVDFIFNKDPEPKVVSKEKRKENRKRQ